MVPSKQFVHLCMGRPIQTCTKWLLWQQKRDRYPVFEHHFPLVSIGKWCKKNMSTVQIGNGHSKTYFFPIWGSVHNSLFFRESTRQIRARFLSDAAWVQWLITGALFTPPRGGQKSASVITLRPATHQNTPLDLWISGQHFFAHILPVFGIWRGKMDKKIAVRCTFCVFSAVSAGKNRKTDCSLSKN